MLALRHAIPRLTAADLSEAEAALNESEKSRDIAVWEAANRRFHNALMRACSMPRLLAAIEDLHRVAARYLYATWKELDWQPRSDKEHRVLLEAARAGNVERASRVLSQHILAAGEALRRRHLDGLS